MSRIIILVKITLKTLRSNLGRTVLTLTGVVVGIIAVILVSSAGEGVKSFVLGQIESFGTDIIQVEVKVPSSKKADVEGHVTAVQITTLKIKDAKALGKLSNVEDYYAGIVGQKLVSYEDSNKTSLLMGAGSHAMSVDRNITLEEGRYYTDQEDDGLAQVVVIGADVRESLFEKSDALGKDVKINNQNYKVVGVLKKRGTVAFFNFDELIYIPVQTLQKKILGIEHVQFISLKVKDEHLLDTTVAEIRDVLRQRHNISDSNKDDFTVDSVKEAHETLEKVFGTINILLLALTSISLLVGGVGIMNVMYVAVAERTFEIGLRKALGAKSSDILRQFLLEAILVTFAGGLIGIILGGLLSVLLSFAFSLLGFDLTFSITWQSVTLACGFSIGVGITFGYYPARFASRLSPMEALRKE